MCPTNNALRGSVGLCVPGPVTTLTRVPPISLKDKKTKAERKLYRTCRYAQTERSHSVILGPRPKPKASARPRIQIKTKTKSNNDGKDWQDRHTHAPTQDLKPVLASKPSANSSGNRIDGNQEGFFSFPTDAFPPPSFLRLQEKGLVQNAIIIFSFSLFSSATLSLPLSNIRARRYRNKIHKSLKI